MPRSGLEAFVKPLHQHFSAGDLRIAARLQLRLYQYTYHIYIYLYIFAIAARIDIFLFTSASEQFVLKITTSSNATYLQTENV
jgi:hypothetical protein